MTLTAPSRMTAEEFIAWAMNQPEGTHYELDDGEVVAMSPERSAHSIVKVEVVFKLMGAIRAQGLPCDVYTDSMAVSVSANTVYEPDIVVRCGKQLDGDVVLMLDPMVIMEVLSPSTRSRDTTIKLVDYFRIPSLRHYVVLNAVKRTIVHHIRGDNGDILTRIIGDGVLRLDPPGITIDNLFPSRE